MAMLTVHHLDNSRSQRVLWLLEELGLDYEVVLHTRSADPRLSPASLTRLHPLGKAPVLCDGALVLAETGAIVEYVMERHAGGRLQPAPGAPERVPYIYWRHFAEASLMPNLAMKLLLGNMARRAPWLVRPLLRAVARAVGRRYLNPNLRRQVDFIEAHLAGHDWFAGAAFSAADVLMTFHLEALAGRLAPADRYPRIAAYLARARARPAYGRAMARGGWSVQAHDRYWAILKD